VEGTLTSANVLPWNNPPNPLAANCPVPVNNLDDLVRNVEAGNAYVAIHTVAWPAARYTLIRGQIGASTPAAVAEDRVQQAPAAAAPAEDRAQQAPGQAAAAPPAVAEQRVQQRQAAAAAEDRVEQGQQRLADRLQQATARLEAAKTGYR
jgi:hypothetical protein